MKFPFIKLEFYNRKHSTIWVDIRTIAQVYNAEDGSTKICTIAEDNDFPVWDSVESIISRIQDFIAMDLLTIKSQLL